MKRLYILFFICFIYLFCTSENDVTGTLSETDSEISAGMYGILVNNDGDSIEGATVVLYALGLNDSLVPVDTTATDSNGVYLFDGIGTAEYAIIGEQKVDSLLYSTFISDIQYDSTIYDSTQLFIGVDTLKAPGAIAGIVEFNQSNKMSVAVYIPGTSYNGYTDSDGSFLLSGIPDGENYKVAFSYPGYNTAIESLINVEGGDTNFMDTVYLTRDSNGISIPPVGLTAIYDTARQQVQILWNKVNDSNLEGYLVYKRDSLLTALEPELISGNQVVKDTFFTDTLTELEISSQTVIQYQVRSINKKWDKSDLSWPVFIKATRPLSPYTIEPALNDTFLIEDKNSEITFKWNSIKGTVDDGYSYNLILFMNSSLDTLKIENLSDTIYNVSQFYASHLYHWYVIAEKDGFEIHSPISQFYIEGRIPTQGLMNERWIFETMNNKDWGDIINTDTLNPDSVNVNYNLQSDEKGAMLSCHIATYLGDFKRIEIDYKSNQDLVFSLFYLNDGNWISYVASGKTLYATDGSVEQVVILKGEFTKNDSGWMLPDTPTIGEIQTALFNIVQLNGSNINIEISNIEIVR